MAQNLTHWIAILAVSVAAETTGQIVSGKSDTDFKDGIAIEEIADTASSAGVLSGQSQAGTSSRRKPLQGIAISTSDPQTEILVDGKSLGAHEAIFVPKEPGEYWVEGRRPGGHPDIRRAAVFPGDVARIGLQTRSLKADASVRALWIVGRERFMFSGVQLMGGVRYRRHFWALSACQGEVFTAASLPAPEGTHFIEDYTDGQFYRFGATWLFTLARRHWVVLESGAAADYCDVTERHDLGWYTGDNPSGTTTWQYIDVHIQRLSVGPRLSVQTGVPFIKLVSTASCMVGIAGSAGLDPWLVLEAGIAVTF